MKKGIINHEGLDKSTSYSAALVNYAFEKSTPFASSKDIYNYLTINFQLEKKLYSINPVIVLAMEFPTRLPDQSLLSSVLTSIPENDLMTLMQAKEKIIESGSKNRTNIKFSDEEIKRGEEGYRQIISSLIEKYGVETVKDTLTATTPFKDPTISAQLTLSFYELLLAKGEEESALIFKTMIIPDQDN